MNKESTVNTPSDNNDKPENAALSEEEKDSVNFDEMYSKVFND